MNCWGITDGSAGMVAQVRALAAALGLTPEMKKIGLRFWYGWQPNAMYAAGFKHLILDYALDKKRSDSLEPPWPDVVISCGRKGALIAMGMRHRSWGKTKFINIQDPRAPGDSFDLIVAMAHDKITGPNVIKTRFALHMITPEVLESARAKFAAQFADYPSPRVAVLFGGSTNKYTLTVKAMNEAVVALWQLLERTPCSLLITPSRRTGSDNIALLGASFAGEKRAYIYDFASENPYVGLLALADYVVVTNDSVNMMTDACATGKPVYILPLAGHTGTKPARFAEGLIRDGMARPLGDSLETWNYPVKNEMAGLARDIKARLAQA